MVSDQRFKDMTNFRWKTVKQKQIYIRIYDLCSTSYINILFKFKNKTKQKQAYQQQQKLKQNNKHLPTTEDKKMRRKKKKKKTENAVNTLFWYGC